MDKNKTISEEERADFREAFSLFDRDGDGVISTCDLGASLRLLGLAPTDEELQDMVDVVDTIGNGKVEFTAFLTVMAKRAKSTDRDEELRDAFAIFDKDDRGYINAEELRNMMSSLGEDLTEDEIRDMIEHADKDGDRQVSFEEFRTMMISS